AAILAAYPADDEAVDPGSAPLSHDRRSPHVRPAARPHQWRSRHLDRDTGAVLLQHPLHQPELWLRLGTIGAVVPDRDADQLFLYQGARRADTRREARGMTIQTPMITTADQSAARRAARERVAMAKKGASTSSSRSSSSSASPPSSGPS